MSIASHNRRPAPAAIEAMLGHAKFLPLGELLDRSDVVSLHGLLSDATHHLIGPAELERLGPDGSLVNTSRGPVVDEVARALCTRRTSL